MVKIEPAVLFMSVMDGESKGVVGPRIMSLRSSDISKERKIDITEAFIVRLYNRQ